MSEQGLFFDSQLATTVSMYSVNDLIARQQNGTLVRRPAYQRNMVWTTRQQGLLIDSMIRGVPVPEIYLQVIASDDGATESHVVVDGQQRISACLDFVAGKFSLPPEPESRSDWASCNFDTLSPEIRRKFRSFKFVARVLPDATTESETRQIFSRLNMTVEALKPQELRHAAYTGEFIQIVEKTAESPFFAEVGVFSARDYLRRFSDELVGEIYFAILMERLPNKKQDLDQAYAFYERKGLPMESRNNMLRRMGRALDVLSPHATELRKTRFRNKSDLYSLIYLLGSEAERLPAGDEFARALLELLVQFSNTVSIVRRAVEGSDGARIIEAQHSEAAALKYWEGVSRAASDRNSRLARHEALLTLIEPWLASADKVRPLALEDEAWFLDTPDSTDSEVEGDQDLEDTEEERMIVQKVIDQA